MRTSARYINRQLLSAFAVTLAVLVAIALGDRLIRFFEKASIGGIPGDMVLFLVMLRMPELLQIIIPVAFYTAILLAFGRLYSSQEMVILQSGGMTTRRSGIASRVRNDNSADALNARGRLFNLGLHPVHSDRGSG